MLRKFVSQSDHLKPIILIGNKDKFGLDERNAVLTKDATPLVVRVSLSTVAWDYSTSIEVLISLSHTSFETNTGLKQRINVHVKRRVKYTENLICWEFRLDIIKVDHGTSSSGRGTTENNLVVGL